MIDPTRAPQWVQLAGTLTARRLPFVCLNVPAPFCAPFKALPPAANEAWVEPRARA